MSDPTVPYDQPIADEPMPPTHLVWAILTTVFCCLPFGIVSIVYTAKVDPHWRNGDRAQAAANSRLAARWAVAGVVLSIGPVAIVLAISRIVS